MASDKRLRKVPGSDFGLPATETAFRASVVGGGAASQVVSLAGRPTSQGRTPAEAMILVGEKWCARLWEESSRVMNVWRINRFGDRRVEGGAALGCVRLHANAKMSGAANLSNLRLYSTVHNPVRQLKTWLK
jgi:hypothetical protein